MASTILYKFQSGTTFEALPLPGSAARLFDVKKAIVKAKKLDNSGSMEFDLAVRNADTNEEYANEGMLLPRGTRLIVQRLPAPRGHGFLARMARNEQLGAPAMGGQQHHQPVAPGSAPSGYYTIDSRARDDEEFVSSGAGVGDDEKELAALQAATSMQTTGPAMTGGGYTGGAPRGAGGPSRGGGPPKPSHYRPNADPELREQEQQAMPKKRVTGVPRTFLNLNAPPKTEGNKDGEDANVPLLQPNALGFKELVNRGGGQSENTAGTRRDLKYALELTATTVPEYLQCGICNGVVKNAMLLPWDPEGRTACELCIRDALTQNGFRCPLTGMDGVSPDDLIPNVALRKASDLFIKGVMEKVDEIEKQQVEEAAVAEDTNKSTEANVLDGDGVEKGVLVSKKMSLSGRKKDADDPFGGGGDDDFGGDVFAVEVEKPAEENEGEDGAKEGEAKKEADSKGRTSTTPTKEVDQSKDDKDAAFNNEESKKPGDSSKILSVATDAADDEKTEETPKKPPEPPKPNRRERRRRGPPVGYSMGPARATGARVAVPPSDDGSQGGGRSGFSPRGRGGRGDFRGGRGRGNFGSDSDRRPPPDSFDDDASRGTKRSYDDHISDDHSPREDSRSSRRHDRHDDRYDGDHRSGGRGGYRGRGSSRGGYRGGRGGYRGRGGGRGYGRGRY